ncbi:uncharacterized protein LOC111068364 [Drosophila obscura]|uniref:uncharacterized protein LOC111068364 n=1 Tax=Drosophila obscura TaxID=7282 RepID=UPI001BB14085|nr:uncharacterized protein LOC111068364 [Drosophila obscura]XP_022213499.2 uncharacterized protein LOC111068364 [Drosophila obscura]
MLLKFNEAFEKYIATLPMPDVLDCKDNEEIAQKIYQAFHEINSIFKGTVSNLEGNYMGQFGGNPGIILKMPFKITPKRVNKTKDFTAYKLMSVVQHPAVQNGYVIPKRITSLFEMDLQRALDSIGRLKLQSGDTYTRFRVHSRTDGHGILRFEIIAFGSNSRSQCEQPHYSFPVRVTFLNYPNTYMGLGSQFVIFDEAALEGPSPNRNIDNLIRFMAHLNVDNFEIETSIDSDLEPIGDRAIEALRRVMISPNYEVRFYVWLKLTEFKKLGSVDYDKMAKWLNLAIDPTTPSYLLLFLRT